MSNIQITPKFIINMHSEETDFVILAERIADGQESGLVEALTDYYADEMPYGVLTGDDMTADEWLADKVAEFEG